jgi:hypothetical protein
MTMPSFTTEATLYRRREFYRASSQWPAAGTVEELTPQGFGCPDGDAFDRHCRNDLGRRGGYCGGF